MGVERLQRCVAYSAFPRANPIETTARSFLQIGFEELVGDDQRLDRLASIATAGCDCLIGSRL
jgi:hypothetical protein